MTSPQERASPKKWQLHVVIERAPRGPPRLNAQPNPYLALSATTGPEPCRLAGLQLFLKKRPGQERSKDGKEVLPQRSPSPLQLLSQYARLRGMMFLLPCASLEIGSTKLGPERNKGLHRPRLGQTSALKSLVACLNRLLVTVTGFGFYFMKVACSCWAESLPF